MTRMHRRALQLATITLVAIAIPELAIAMGPTSAPQKVFTQPSGSSTTVGSAGSTCGSYEQPCPVPHSRPHHRARSARR
jgi:hypothetical protein